MADTALVGTLIWPLHFLSACLPRLKPMQDQCTILGYVNQTAFQQQLLSHELPPAPRQHHECQGSLCAMADTALVGTLIWPLHFLFACLPRLKPKQDQCTILEGACQTALPHQHSS